MKTRIQKSFTREQGEHLIHSLLYDTQSWGRFLMDSRVQGILFKAILAHGLQDKVSINDVGNSFFLYSLNNNAWLTNEKDPARIYGYFSVTIHHLLSNRHFLKNYLGIDPKVPVDPLPPTPIPENSEDSPSLIAADRVDEFKQIIAEVSQESPVLGELLNRYYLEMDDIRAIAADFLNRGWVKTSCNDGEKALDAATNNLQTRKLNAARTVFNQIALDKGFPFRLDGKVKKSIMRTIYAQHDWQG